ncbi:DUF1127 domain-containing protein [Arenibaculum pallidiluteum]|uniref:DUF1127 domain-containing protein n=1 Tax=Arenibaculum pallidiluteum TaxID=2812559 RepID=UPI001A963FE2|nr:DUF1127 domain-containing protein [Arenibaculum pallidiluteum]
MHYLFISPDSGTRHSGPSPSGRRPIVTPRPADRSPGVPGRAVSALAGILLSLIREIRNRRAIKKLAEFDDRELADIGTSRSSIESAVRYGRPDDARTGFPPH